MVSVIVPIYNVEKYLKRCIDSILMQTYKDMEIVLVDDGSTDQCIRMCDEYERLDNRVVVIHKQNVGLVSARKAGLKIAGGEFIGWVDGDDWIEPDYFKQMVKAQLSTDADIVASNHFHDIGEESNKIYNRFPVGLYTKEQLLHKLLYSGSFFEYGLQPHVWTKLFRKEIIIKTQMVVDERIVVGEDAAVVYPSVLAADKICITDICGYHYVQNPTGITKNELKNEAQMYQILFKHLETEFRAKGVFGLLGIQLEQYKKYILFMRQMSVFDELILLPYGGIPKNSKIIIYGAGVLGQKMYKYLSSAGEINIVLWVDKNYLNYRAGGLDVKSPEEIQAVKEFDYILIANISKETSASIRNYLLDMQIRNDKIRWFTNRFIEGSGYEPYTDTVIRG